MSLCIHECEQGEHLSGFLTAYQVLGARGADNLVPSSWVLLQAAALLLGPESLRSSGAQGTQQKIGHLLCGQFKEFLCSEGQPAVWVAGSSLAVVILQ